MSKRVFSMAPDIKKFKFSISVLEDIQDYLREKNLWPLVYIINNKIEAYIGESASPLTRINNHLQNAERKSLKDIFLITSDKFNKSATLDIEANLIRYISGDNIFKLQNGNAGLAYHNYYQKSEYWELFSDIWSKLKEERLVRQELDDIGNSDLFKFSPYKSLSEDQSKAIHEIIYGLLAKPATPIFIEGIAGTGKTILAVFLMKLLKTGISDLTDRENFEGGYLLETINEFKANFKNPEVALVVPMASLRNTLKKVFRNIKGLSSNMVIGPTDLARKKYDVLLIDEAHRLRRRINITNYKRFDEVTEKLGFDNDGTELDWICKQSEHQVFFYDPAQTIRPSDVEKKRFDEILSGSKKVYLTSQLRVKGGLDYLKYVNNLLNVSLTAGNPIFQSNEYEFVLYDSLAMMIEKIKQREAKFRLSRLVAGFAWKWKSKKNKNLYDITIEDIKLKWNIQYNEWINSANAIHEVGCIHTTQGYDLNYVGVIFGEEISYDPKADEIIIRPEKYYDRNGKASIKDPTELKSYIINIYKTLMYRGMKGTYVYVCDKNLREYFRRHISLKYH